MLKTIEPQGISSKFTFFEVFNPLIIQGVVPGQYDRLGDASSTLEASRRFFIERILDYSRENPAKVDPTKLNPTSTL